MYVYINKNTNIMKHTKGEWKVNNGGFVYTSNDDPKQMQNVICQINTKSNFQKEANAKLIAAAPDLLEALQDLLSYQGWDENPLHKGLKSQAEQAIKKATE